MTTASDAGIDVEDLDLDFFTEVDGRQTRILSLGLNTDVGINVPFNNQTGDLAVDIDLDGNRVDPTLPYNEFMPDSNDLILDSFLDQFDTILGLIDIESLVGDLAFTLPAINGVGLSDLRICRYWSKFCRCRRVCFSWCRSLHNVLDVWRKVMQGV